MLLADLNPHIRYARVHKNTLGFKGKTSICYDCRLFFFQNISGDITINGNEYPIREHTAVFLPPETRYQFHMTFREDARAIVLDFDLTNEHAHLSDSLGTATEETFDVALIPAYSLPEELSQPIVLVLPQLSRMLLQCSDYFLFREPFFRESASAMLKLCLLQLVHQSRACTQSPICEDVLLYIHSQYADASLTNLAIANHFNYHPDHLSNLIRQRTGMTLHQYLMFYRVQVAKNFLLTTQYDISEIAWRSGFCTAAYFIKIFRRHTGMTPRTYRQQRIHTEI